VPYDILISDLSFKVDHTPTKLSDAQELIAGIKKIQQDNKIVVF
jgi:hypothetical protein